MNKQAAMPILCSALTAAAVLISGCKARQMGVAFAEKQAANVDNSWLVALNSCWPDLGHQGYSVADVKRYLADPLHFRAAFAAYSPLSDGALLKVVTQPVLSAPQPDPSVLDHSPNPVLTRSQALAGGTSRGSLTSDNNGVASQDSLCAVEAGTPVGFK